MGFCTEEEYERFLRVCPVWECDLIEAGITLIKYWFEVSQEEQTRRFSERINDPRKIWKLSPMDLESHRRWYDYARARLAQYHPDKVAHLGPELRNLAAQKTLEFNLAIQFIEQHLR
jgi:polyphosphate kinase 2 (PPK2 family)